MDNDIFTPGEGFSQYNEEQLALLRKITQNNRTKKEKITTKVREEVRENLRANEEGEYLLGLT